MAFERVNAEMIGRLLGKAANMSAPGDDRISVGILKVFFGNGTNSALHSSSEPAFGSVITRNSGRRRNGIPKAGNPDYSKVRAYQVICRLDVISKLVERTAGHLIADHLERKGGLQEGQYGCCKRRSCIDAVAVLMNRTQQAWGRKKIAGMLFMDVKSALNNVSKAHLGKRMEDLELAPDLIGWTHSFMTDRQVKIVLDGETGQAHPVDTGIPQGSPEAPILFVTYLSGIINQVEREVPGIRGLSFTDDIAWWAEGGEEQEVADKLADAAKVAIEWAGNSGIAFDEGKTEAALFGQKDDL
jgi:hypothetical protein